MNKLFLITLGIASLISFGTLMADDDFDEFSTSTESSESQLNLEGFLLFEQGSNISRVGLQKNNGRDYVLANKILRLQSSKTVGEANLNFKLDFKSDDISSQNIVDIREAKVSLRLSENTDISFGRQISTWGVGDYIFINDLFPKDWIALFTGREMEYIKNPSNSIRLTTYLKKTTFDFVYQPQFSADHTPTGCRFSIFNPNQNTLAIDSNSCSNSTTNSRNGGKLDDGELALAIKTKFLNHEIALYGYHGFYKAPKGLLLSGTTLSPFYPRLNVIGISDEGQLGPGIFSFEFGNYSSVDDKNGGNYLIENSMYKYLVGYKVDLNSNLSIGLQFYQEKMKNYQAYEQSVQNQNLNAYSFRKKEYQSTYTLRLTYKAQQETLWVSLFSYIRPDDKDSFSQFSITKRINDQFQISSGVNIFTGTDNYLDREFGMLKNDDNGYVRLKLIF